VDGLFALVRDCLRAEEPVALATVIELAPSEDGLAEALPPLGAKLVVRRDTEPAGSLGQPGLDGVVIRDTRGTLDGGQSVARHYGPHGEAGRTDVTVFIEVFAPPPRMLIFGAVDFTAA
jgi:xanthine dehydrogenase accessory factor